MKRKTFILKIVVIALFLGTGTLGWAQNQPPPDNETLPPTPIEGYYFWNKGFSFHNFLLTDKLL